MIKPLVTHDFAGFRQIIVCFFMCPDILQNLACPSASKGAPMGWSRSGISRQHLKDSRDEVVKLRHVAAQEFLGRLYRDLPIVSDQSGSELDIRLNGVHLRRIAKRENAAEAC